MSRNRSGSYDIQGQIRLLQIRTLVFCRYRSQIHYTEVIVVTTGLILIRTSRRSYRTYSYAELMLIPNLCLFKTPVGVTELIHIQNLYLTDLFSVGTPVGVTELIQIQEYP